MSTSGEQPDPNREQVTALTTGDFLGWYEGQKAQLDAETAQLQLEAETDPALIDDPTFREREAHLIGKKELLDKAGEDFSQHTFDRQAQFIIERAFADETENDS